MSSRLARTLLAAVTVTGVAAIGFASTGGGIDAEVTEKATDANGAYIVATTDVGGLEFQRYIHSPDWMVIQEGDDVVYRLHDGETSVYTWESGELLWRG